MTTTAKQLLPVAQASASNQKGLRQQLQAVAGSRRSILEAVAGGCTANKFVVIAEEPPLALEAAADGCGRKQPLAGAEALARQSTHNQAT